MSLATRCTACGTIFRVVQDQLRVSEGWVRCGRCAEVFDAREQLFDIDREAPPPWPAPAEALDVTNTPNTESVEDNWQFDETPTTHADQHNSGFSEPEHVQAFVPPPELAADAAPEIDVEQDHAAPQATAPYVSAGGQQRQEPRWVDDAPPDNVDEEPRPKPAGVAKAPKVTPVTAAPAEPLVDDKPDVLLSKSLEAAAQAAAKSAVSAASPSAKSVPGKSGRVGKSAADATNQAAVPSFMRKPADGQHIWQRGTVRAALGLGVLLSMLLLGTQVLFYAHDAMAATWPQTRPALMSFCKLAGCELRPWQRIEHVAVESTALSQMSPGSASARYQLAISLRNKGHVELATPWVELSLTDASGALVSRRLLAPNEFRSAAMPLQSAQATVAAASAPPAPSSTTASTQTATRDSAALPVMAAGAELPLQVVLSTGAQRISGYSVEIFYP
ncbi:zinc-ribbon and DUF3426 domain-containing protein [Roseateles koreensis]|uniref:Zinc-ribbon and DUF3426 domain-containing protein n=1 Tax=Roseateles koreensis TaxID=2987526 RepID=A0ABT5KMR2_9BURK|nr:zinc-ribbon and DUF3426 domain-containing protein [Roseateles koreensis]MDC8784217.1 zinc-ribbon and DUF3426 domain-containing protein [Roseateles koreensis]